MQYRKFGNTDLLVSEIGFGAWAIGGGAMIGNTAIGWGDADDNVSIKAIHTALDAGINFFDTADIYGLGHSEELLVKQSVIRRKSLLQQKLVMFQEMNNSLLIILKNIFLMPVKLL